MTCGDSDGDGWDMEFCDHGWPLDCQASCPDCLNVTPRRPAGSHGVRDSQSMGATGGPARPPAAFAARQPVTAYGPCVTCHQPFTYDPGTVLTILVDPVTELPPDKGGDPARAVRAPLCPHCVDLIDAIRAVKGLPPVGGSDETA